MDRLAAYSESVGDLLPRPPLIARVSDLKPLEPFQQPAQGGDRPEPDLGVFAAGSRCELRCV